jgi:tRNA(adenine34) deaminase
MWNALSTPWQACVTEAWSAYQAGSIPIGAVVTTADRQIVARGHNRIYGQASADHQLAGHRLAHAELNALLALDTHFHSPSTCTLYTTTEPCPLCFGALVMMPIGQLAYAARDPTAGSAMLFDASPFVRSRNIVVSGPRDAAFEIVLVALRVCWRFETMEGRIGRVISALQSALPIGVEVGRQLYERQVLQHYRREGMAAEAMLDEVAALLARREHSSSR